MTGPELLERLRRDLGDLGGWWPGETPFEVAVGAVLVQAVSWRNAQLAIENLRARSLLEPARLAEADAASLAEAIRPALYRSAKARYLLALARFVRDELGGDLAVLRDRPPAERRRLLLSVEGVGPETAAAIEVYALGGSAGVADAYALRVLPRTGALRQGLGPAEAAAAMAGWIAGDAERARVLHAGIVELARRHCRPAPLCAGCPLGDVCPRLLGHPAQGRGDGIGKDAGRADAGREAGDSGRSGAEAPKGSGGRGTRTPRTRSPRRVGRTERARERARRRHPGA